METQKIENLSGDANNESSKFATRRWYVINNQNDITYGEGNEDSTTVKFETEVTKSSLCDYSDNSCCCYIFSRRHNSNKRCC